MSDPLVDAAWIGFGAAVVTTIGGVVFHNEYPVIRQAVSDYLKMN